MAVKKKFTGRIGQSLYDSTISFDVQDSPSEGKPNVIYILLDDLGFAQLGCYGSTIYTPHHAPREYIDKYKGAFDKGWDVIREEWFRNQKRLGVIPSDAELTDRNEFVPAWNTLSDEQKKAYARYMETFAGMLENTDAQIGRLIDFLDKSGILDDTIIVFTSDNGASAEGGKDGHFNQNTSMDSIEDYLHDVELALKHYDTIGDEYSLPHYPTGWANAGNVPFQWYKTWVYEGGVKDPLIIRYPAQIRDQGAVRTQFSHVSDITPTVLDMLGFENYCAAEDCSLHQ